MLLTAHCFLKNATISGLPIELNFNKYKVRISYSSIPTGEKETGLVLEITRKVAIDEIKIDKETMEKERMPKVSKKILEECRKDLNEIAVLLEGLFSVTYAHRVGNKKIELVAPPPFETKTVVVNIVGENSEEYELLRSGKVIQGCGDIYYEKKPIQYAWSDKTLNYLQAGYLNLPFLSFFSQGLRSFHRGETEVSFFLFFKIVEGYFGNGSKDVEKALIKNKTKLQKHFKIDPFFLEALRGVLKNLSLPSKATSVTDIEGTIKDLVLLRHKLLHFSKSKPNRYYYSQLKFHLKKVVRKLSFVCYSILREELNVQ